MFNTYEELRAAVEERRKDILTIEVDLGTPFSQEYEDAKTELQQAKAMKTLAGGAEFLGDNIAALEARVAELKPVGQPIWIQFSRLSLEEWSMLTKQANLTPVDQYERVLPKTFIGVYGADPLAEDEDGKLLHPGLEPLTTEASVMSSRHPDALLTGGAMHQLIQAFMAWQNSGGEVSIRPTRSGRD